VGDLHRETVLAVTEPKDADGSNVETTMEQKEQLQHLSADELWSMREDVDLKLATILLKRKSMLEERLERLQPRQVQSRVR
jgi:hypothetical protein